MIPHERSALRRLIETRLRDTRPATDPGAALPAGLAAEAASGIRRYFPPRPVAAAVLLPIVDRPEGLSVLLTRRSLALKHHAGEISFPGGRIEPGDGGPLEAALRETQEEVGLPREHVTPAGYLDPHLVLSGFWVTPVVGFVRPGFTLELDRREVDATFEAPLLHVFDARNHQPRERRIGDVTVRMYDIRYGEHLIWGATAAMLLELYRLLANPQD